jgi:serine/threonine protein kinase
LQLGRYQILKQLASGSVADVLLARASGLEGFARHVVIKQIRPEMAAEDRFVKAFLDEARIAGSLHHQNIVTVHDIGEQDGSYFFAMEYVHGEDARRLIGKVRERGEHIPLEHALSIVMAAAAGLHYAHEQSTPSGERLGLVHRDVTPSNILIGYDGSVKIVDFGMAKAVARSNTTSTGVLKGKASYMSPEQCTGKPIDRRTDIFCLGIVLFELITAQRLFKGVNEFMTMAAIVEGQIPKPSSLRTEIPPALDEIIMRALERSPESRYQTAESLRESLEAFALAQELRTSHKAVSDYLTGLFGHRPEPWEAHAASQPSPPPIDDEGTYAKGLVAAPSGRREDVMARLAPRAESPIALADGANEWDDDDEDIKTAAGGGHALQIRNRTNARPASESHIRTAPAPTVKGGDEATLTKTDAGPAPSPDDTTQLPLAGDTSTMLAGDTSTMPLAGDTTVIPVSASTPPPSATTPLRRPRATGEELDSRTVVEPPIFDGGLGVEKATGDDDDEFENEAATEIAGDDDQAWKQHHDPAATLPPPTRAGAVRKPAVVPRAKLPGARAAASPTRPPPPTSPSAPPPPASLAPAARPPLGGSVPTDPLTAPTLPERPTPPPPRQPAGAPMPHAMPPPGPLMSGGPGGAATLVGTGAPSAPPVFGAPQPPFPTPPGSAPMAPLATPGMGMGMAPAAYGAGVSPGNELRSPLQLFVMKHATRIWIAGGIALILLVVLASRGCGEEPRRSGADSSDVDRSGPDK